jgi:arginase family enzyme
MGYGDPWFPIKSNLPFSNLLYFGIRDLDDFEQQKVTDNNIFNTRLLNEMVNKIANILSENSNAVFHISFDVDALDSSIIKSTGCVVDSGLFPEDVITVINMVKHKLIAFDLVEFNPDIGSHDDVSISYKSIEQIVIGVSK